MKKTITLFSIIFLLNISLFGQKGYFFRPDKSQIFEEFPTSGHILRFLGEEFNDHEIKNVGYVLFKKLSKKPLLIYLKKKSDLPKIPQMIASYDLVYEKYINSNIFINETKWLLKDGKITKDFLLSNFGKPDTSIDETRWFYKSVNLDFSFIGDTAYSFMYINSKAINNSKISIPIFEVNSSDSYIGFKISFYNSFNKDIKYIYLTASAFNSVSDKISTKTVSCIGPIYSNESGSYDFDKFLYSNIAEYIELDQMKIQFTDNTVKVIPRSVVNKLIIYSFDKE